MAPVDHSKFKEEPVIEEWPRAIPVRKSVTEDFMICLEAAKVQVAAAAPDGKIRTRGQVRGTGAPTDPMAVPSYVRESSELRTSGLGRTLAKVPPTILTPTILTPAISATT